MSNLEEPHDEKQLDAGAEVFQHKPEETKKFRSLDKVILILGAPGLVGAQVTRQIARDLCPDKIILASLYKSDFVNTIDKVEVDLVKELYNEMSDLAKKTEMGELKKFKKEDYLNIEFIKEYGNIFVRPELALVDREELERNSQYRQMLYEDLFEPLSKASQHSKLVQIVHEYKPDVIIDCINTATGISYQDIDTGCKEIRKLLSQVKKSQEDNPDQIPLNIYTKIENAVELLLVSQSIPQIVRHIQLFHTAMVEEETRLYIKVGTTGTGGMGLNIPYTHGEDRPSVKLMTKSSVGFAHTGLMFLMARTPGGPIVKEIKPGAMIGYKKVVCQSPKKCREYVPTEQKLTHELKLKLPVEDFEAKKDPIEMVGIDTGENGFFARGEFEAVTSINQMEFVTPEEIARAVVLEIRGSNTGHDVIAAIDGAVMPPSYRAGYLRGSAIDSLLKEQEQNPFSVATGELGPPKLTKLLYEAHLLYLVTETLPQAKKHTLQVIIDWDSKELSKALERYLNFNDKLRNTITSIGIPILLPDGKTLLRGPRITVPEDPSEESLPIDDDKIKKWADQGWLDLRIENIEQWQGRFRKNA